MPSTLTGTAAAAPGLTRPSVLDGLHELAAVIGAPAALGLWAEAVTATGCHGMDLSVADHLTVLAHVVATADDAAARTVARGLITRLTSFRLLGRG